ncbi:MAG: alpha/beta hydrolase [Candidatus Staskawiczbacteria bacterium]|nr:alpha/beta hydrolase [Candidatus Staskawiczbacteria bacterium]
MEITINGVKINYQIFGEGLPFLILHGWGSNSDRWVAIAEKIAEKGYKVVVPDLPGFGKSDALTTAWNMNNYINWAEGFVKEIGLKEFYLAGHSFGGALACKFAINHPQDVKKLFLISAASVRKRTPQKSFLKNIAKVVKKLSFLPYYSLFRRAFYKFIIRKSDYPYVEGLMKDTFKNVISEDLSQFTGFIRTPTVIIWGDKDKSTPIEDAYFLNQKIPGSKLIVINGVGHILTKDCPEVLVEKVLENI